MLFAVLLEIRKDLVDKTVVLLVRRNAQTVFFKVCEGEGGIVIFSVVDLGCGELVADTFHEIDVGHQGWLGALGIDPILGMVLVAPLVVQPRARYARLTAAGTEGGAISPKVLHALEELLRMIFRQIVHQAAVRYAASDRMPKHKPAVARDEAQMGKQLFHRTPFVAVAT